MTPNPESKLEDYSKYIKSCKECGIYDHRKYCDCKCHNTAPNTGLVCNICHEGIGSVCMMSPDWSANESFRSQARYHFKTKHRMGTPTP